MHLRRAPRTEAKVRRKAFTLAALSLALLGLAAMPAAGSQTRSPGRGSSILTIMRMTWRGVRNWPASPWEPRTERRYSKASPRRSLWS